MPRIDAVRSELQRLRRAVQFHRFILILESGEHALVEYPENVAFDPEPDGSEDVYIISRTLRLFTTLGAISGIHLADHDGAAA